MILITSRGAPSPNAETFVSESSWTHSYSVGRAPVLCPVSGGLLSSVEFPNASIARRSASIRADSSITEAIRKIVRVEFVVHGTVRQNGGLDPAFDIEPGTKLYLKAEVRVPIL